MTNSDYSLLSDREREYLENPEAFDSAQAAEISQRIRNKYEPARRGIHTLNENAKLWDKTGSTSDVEFKCRFHKSMGGGGPKGFGECDSIQVVEEYHWVGKMSASGVFKPPREWDLRLSRSSWLDHEQFGVCPDCRSKAKEHVRKHGTVPCTESSHTAHRIADTKQLEICRGESSRGSDNINQLALSIGDLREMRASGVFDGRIPDDPVEPQ
jgi:hypothetical protein